MIEFVKALLAGEYDVKGLYAYAVSLFETAKTNEGFLWLTDKITGMLGGVLPIVMIAIGALFVIRGQKSLWFFKFFIAALGGYAIGSYIVTPIINNIFPLKATLCGLIVCLVCAVCCKSVYLLAISVASGMITYSFFYANGLLPFALPTEGNSTLCYVAVAIVVLTVLITRKQVERIGTAALGSWILCEALARNYVPAIESYQLYIFIAVWVLGYLYQYKKRKRY